MNNFYKSRFFDPCLLIFLFLVILGYIFARPLKINDNSALLMEGSSLLLKGKMLYVDFYELDPPMIFYLFTIPVGIARFLSVNEITIFIILVGFFVLWSVLSIRKTLFKSKLNFTSNEVYSVLLFYTFFSLWTMRVNDWGQREHLFTLTLLPFLTVRFVRNENGYVSTVRSFLIGIIAGLFTVLKQYFLLIILFPELYAIIKRKSIKQLFSSELWGLALVCLLYLIHFFFLPAQMFNAFFYRWVPILIKYYIAFNHDLEFLLYNYALYLCCLLFLISLIFYKKYTSRIASFLPTLYLGFIVSICVYIFQSKGFVYHLDPAAGITSIILGISFAELTLHIGHKWSSWIKVVLCLIAGLLMTYIPQAKPSLLIQEETISKYTKKNERVLFLSTSVYHPYPLLMQMNRQIGSRFTTMFPFSFFTKETYSDNPVYKSWDQLSSEETAFLSEVLEDIHTMRPALILIKNSDGCQGCPLHFNIYKYLDHAGFINKISLNYMRQEDIPDFAVFTLKESEK